MTAQEIIQETVDYYAQDPVRRRATYTKPEEGLDVCKYRTPFYGRKCAVGRCMTDDALDELANSPGSIRTVLVTSTLQPGTTQQQLLDSWLQECYRGHDPEFWFQLQKLHDTSGFWDGQGLTSSGELFVFTLLARFGRE